ncbi:MAG TPA: heparinase II/III family protein, partial [Chitinophagaceae bacterium]
MRLAAVPVLLLFVSLCSHAQDVTKMKVPTSHPRLMLGKGEEAIIRKKIEADSFLMSIHQTIIRKSNEFLTTPVLDRTLTGKAMLKVSRTALTYIYYLAYSWRMTGDKRYAERAKKELLNVCSFTSWNPSHFLDVAEMTMAASIGYDWLFDYLDPKTKKIIEEAILVKGLYESLPEKATDKENYSWLKKKNNWNSVCNTSMAAGALILYHQYPQMAQKIIDRSIKLVRDVALEEYMPNGNYPEGYTYWTYGTTYNLLFINILEKIYGTSFGLADNTGFKATPEFILQMSTQDKGCFAFADCFTDFTLSFPMFWFANRSGNNAILWGEANKLAYMRKQGQSDDDILAVRYLPSVLLWASPKPFDGIKAPSKRLFVGQGTTPVALLRNHWGGKDEIFVGLKGGSCLTNHSHMDIGSFVMYRGANQWIKDMGAQEYYSLEKFGINLGDRKQESRRWDVLRLSSKLHNIMMFNGAKQNVGAKAYITASGDKPDFVYAMSDLSSIDSVQIKKHQRGVAIVDNKYVMIRDEVTNTDNLTDTRWAMLTPASVRIINDHEAELSMNGEKLLVKIEGEGIKLRTWSTEPEYAFDEENKGTIMLGFTAVMEPGATKAFTVLLIPENTTTRKDN